MKKIFHILIALLFTLCSFGENEAVNVELLGAELGGWEHKNDQAAEYKIHGSKYRTWKPTITKTLAGGTFLSLRIDHCRGMFSSDDHATIELEFDEEKNLIGANSTVVFQGQSMKGDAIKATSKVGGTLAGLDAAVKLGTDLVSDLSAKILHSKKNEPGRVTMPAVIRHNYNLLCISCGIVVESQNPPVKFGAMVKGKSPSPNNELKITQAKPQKK